MSVPRHFLDLDRLSPADLRDILDRARRYKAERAAGTRHDLLAGRSLALIFEQPSTRTRVSFEVGMRQLGGDVVIMDHHSSQLGRGESIADTARVLSRYVDAIVLRARSAATLQELADCATVPVINGLTDRSHPCQIMADIQTLEEHRGPVAGQVVAWIGDGNNVASSWIHGAVRFGFELRLACPSDFQPAADVMAWARAEGGRVHLTENPEEAATGADCVVTDAWVSMHNDDAEVRAAALGAYRVDERLMALGRPDAVFLHCLPCYRGKEVAAEVIDGPRSLVWDEAENRLHAQKGILSWCLT